MRRSALALLLLGFLPAALAGAPEPSATPVVVWTATDADGPVEHRPAYELDDHWTRVRQGDLLAPLSTVRTGRRGHAVLDSTASRVTVGPDAEIELPAPTDRSSVQEILHSRGTVSYEIREGGRSLEVVTPLAVIGVDEAEIAVGLQDARAVVTVHSGSVRLTSRIDGSTARLGPGDVASVAVEGGGAPEIRHRVVAAGAR